MAATEINPARVRELFTYEPFTGQLVWARPQGRIKAGAVAGGMKSDDPLYRYWVIRMDGRRYRRSRLVWAWVHGESPPHEIDHIDRDKTNDRIENLRLSTRAQNAINRHCPKLVYPDLPRGVRPKRKNGRIVGYRGRATIDGRRMQFGEYATPEEAGAAVLDALTEAFGDEWLPQQDPRGIQGPYPQI